MTGLQCVKLHLNLQLCYDSLDFFFFFFRRTVEEDFTRLPFEASNKAMLVTGYADEDPD